MLCVPFSSLVVYSRGRLLLDAERRVEIFFMLFVPFHDPFRDRIEVEVLGRERRRRRDRARAQRNLAAIVEQLLSRLRHQKIDEQARGVGIARERSGIWPPS